MGHPADPDKLQFRLRQNSHKLKHPARGSGVNDFDFPHYSTASRCGGCRLALCVSRTDVDGPDYWLLAVWGINSRRC